MNKIDVKSLRNSITKSVQKIHIPGLINISLVGSFQYTKSLSKINDVDLVILVKKLNQSIFSKINKSFNDIANRLSSSNLVVIVENRIGPLKPKAIKGKKVIQLHLLIYDINAWKKRKSPSTFDWINFNKKLVGTKLRSIKKLNLGRDEVIQDIKESVLDMKTKAAYTRIYKFVNSKPKLEIIPIKLSREEHVENCIYNILISFLNYIRYFKPTIKNDKPLVMLEARKKLPTKHYLLIKDSFKIKERIRNGKKVLKKDSARLNKEGIEFVRYLLKELNKVL